MLDSEFQAIESLKQMMSHQFPSEKEEILAKDGSRGGPTTTKPVLRLYW